MIIIPYQYITLDLEELVVYKDLLVFGELCEVFQSFLCPRTIFSPNTTKSTLHSLDR